jgi:hypothetical protein
LQGRSARADAIRAAYCPTYCMLHLLLRGVLGRLSSSPSGACVALLPSRGRHLCLALNLAASITSSIAVTSTIALTLC